MAPIVLAWQAVQTQWRHAGMDGVATGLDYPAVRAALEATGIWAQAEAAEQAPGPGPGPGPGQNGPTRRELWAGLQLLEDEALAVWSERRRKTAAARERAQGRGARDI